MSDFAALLQRSSGGQLDIHTRSLEVDNTNVKTFSIPRLDVFDKLTVQSEIITHARVKKWYETSNMKGDKGDKGIKGDKGVKGVVGQRGDPGQPGQPGIRGVDGAQGEKGPRGIQGLQGETGPVGEKGDTGDVGDIGPVGASGINGPVGQSGYTPPLIWEIPCRYNTGQLNIMRGNWELITSHPQSHYYGGFNPRAAMLFYAGTQGDSITSTSQYIRIPFLYPTARNTEDISDTFSNAPFFKTYIISDDGLIETQLRSIVVLEGVSTKPESSGAINHYKYSLFVFATHPAIECIAANLKVLVVPFC